MTTVVVDSAWQSFVVLSQFASTGSSLSLSCLVAIIGCVLAGVCMALGDPRGRSRHGFDAQIVALASAAPPPSRPAPGADADADADADWNERPNDLSDEELKLLQQIYAITFALGDDDAAGRAVWRMVGGGKPQPSAPEQLSFTALRYHLSFTAYATPPRSARHAAAPRQPVL